jgi:hypothetical protein
MEQQEVLVYTRAAAHMLDLPLDGRRAQAVAVHLGRTALLAQALDAVPLLPEVEPAEVYSPSPFPSQDAGQ